MTRLVGLAALLLLAQPAHAQEAETAALFDQVAAQPARLRVFLQAMPKGGDLHNHLGGGAYAEDIIAWGGEQGLCASRSRLAIVPCSAGETEPLRDLGRRDPKLYSAMIDSLSNRGRNQGLGVNDATGHADFFDSFARFSAASLPVPGAMVAAAQRSAAANNVSYLELTYNPAALGKAGVLGAAEPWQANDFEAELRRVEPALPGLLAQATAETDATLADARRRLNCGAAGNEPACGVAVRFQAFAFREQPPGFVFGQLALAFALAERDRRFVAVNFVAPEDGPVALADFDLHMRMFHFFAARHPTVQLSLHAGELDLGLVPPADLADHIRQSVEVAGAKRIGHGVDIPYETDAPGLLARMARDRIAVEINLTSNDTILGVRGTRHPLALYRAAGVPFVLSTDDEGISRSDMTNEYLRAVTEQDLRYADLKAAARASLEYAFLPGASLWRGGRIGALVEACTAPDKGCADLLATSEKARAQSRLEHEFADFERKIVTQKF